MTAWPLIGLDIFNFSETAKRNLPTLDRKQEINVFYQVCVLWDLSKEQDSRPASDWQKYFRIFL